MPCSDLLLNIFNIFGLKIGEKIGVKNAILLAITLELISLLVLLFIPKYIMVLFAMGLFGIGIAMNSLIVTKNGWKYFPNRKGLVNGINMSASGLSSSFLTPIADYGIINPDKIGTDSDGLYPEKIANRLPRYLYVLIGIFFLIGSISYFTTFNYEKEKKENLNEDMNDEKILNNNEIEEEIIEDEEKKEEKIVQTNEEKNELKNEEKKEEIITKESNKNQNTITTKELFSLYFSKKNAQLLSISIGGPSKKNNF